jgi:hypothetical protein
MRLSSAVFMSFLRTLVSVMATLNMPGLYDTPMPTIIDLKPTTPLPQS